MVSLYKSPSHFSQLVLEVLLTQVFPPPLFICFWPCVFRNGTDCFHGFLGYRPLFSTTFSAGTICIGIISFAFNWNCFIGIRDYLSWMLIRDRLTFYVAGGAGRQGLQAVSSVLSSARAAWVGAMSSASSFNTGCAAEWGMWAAVPIFSSEACGLPYWGAQPELPVSISAFISTFGEVGGPVCLFPASGAVRGRWQACLCSRQGRGRGGGCVPSWFWLGVGCATQLLGQLHLALKPLPACPFSWTAGGGSGGGGGSAAPPPPTPTPTGSLALLSPTPTCAGCRGGWMGEGKDSPPVVQVWGYHIYICHSDFSGCI